MQDYEKVLNLHPDASGNMYFRGDWKYNPEYHTGDVVLFSGKLYLARKHNAGKDPSTHPECWQRVGLDLPKPPKPERKILYGGSASLQEQTPSYEIRLRIDSALNWEAANPQLALGEAGIDITNHKFKIGNGIDNWNELPYMNEDIYDMLEAEQQAREEANTDITHQLEEDKLETEQDIADLQAQDRVILSRIITAEDTRRDYEQRVNAELEAGQETLAQELAELSDLQNTINARLDAAIGQFTEDSEILDARVDIDNETYPNAGSNIRHTQSRLIDLHEYTQELQEQINQNASGVLSLVNTVRNATVREAQNNNELLDYIRHEELSRLDDRNNLMEETQQLGGVVLQMLTETNPLSNDEVIQSINNIFT